jgi:hypothetical protein
MGEGIVRSPRFYRRRKVGISSSLSSDKGEVEERGDNNISSSQHFPTGNTSRKKIIRTFSLGGFPQESVEIFEHWNSKGPPLRKHRFDTKLANEAFKAITRYLANGSTRRKIRNAIDRYHELLSSEDTFIESGIGHRVSLDEFFRFKTSTRRMMATKSKLPLKIFSWYEECTSGINLLEKYSFAGADWIRPEKGEHQDIAEILMSEFGKKIRHTKHPRYSQKERNGFLLSANKLVGFREKLTKEYGTAPKISDLVDYLFSSLKWFFEGRPVHLGNLISDYTYEQILPTYLDENAIMDWIKVGAEF